MTHVSSDTVLKLAKLSGLRLAESEVEPLRADIEAILGYVEQLDDLKLDDVEPTYQVTGLVNVSRSDDPRTDIVPKSRLLELAPEKSDDYVEVPKVL